MSPCWTPSLASSAHPHRPAVTLSVSLHCPPPPRSEMDSRVSALRNRLCPFALQPRFSPRPLAGPRCSEHPACSPFSAIPWPLALARPLLSTLPDASFIHSLHEVSAWAPLPHLGGFPSPGSQHPCACLWQSPGHPLSPLGQYHHCLSVMEQPRMLLLLFRH